MTFYRYLPWDFAMHNLFLVNIEKENRVTNNIVLLYNVLNHYYCRFCIQLLNTIKQILNSLPSGCDTRHHFGIFITHFHWKYISLDSL